MVQVHAKGKNLWCFIVLLLFGNCTDVEDANSCVGGWGVYVVGSVNCDLLTVTIFLSGCLKRL